MDWFLYDNGLRHESVKSIRPKCIIRKPMIAGEQEMHCTFLGQLVHLVNCFQKQSFAAKLNLLNIEAKFDPDLSGPVK